MNLHTRLSPIKLAALAAAITLYSCTSIAPSGTPAPVSTPASSPERTAVPSVTPALSGPALTETFTSEMHGISLSYPAGWLVQRASQPWTGDPFFFREPVGDFLYDPALDDHLFLALASQPLSGKTPSSWAADLLAAEGCDASEPVVVDGAEGLMGSDCDVVLTGIDDRGYIIWLYVSADDPAVREVYDRAWFEQVLATVQLDPTSAPTSPEPGSTAAVGDMRWSPQSAAHDWPGPIRTEPGGAPLLITQGPIGDPTGELEGDAPGWIDIREVSLHTPVYVYLADALTLVGNPAESWVAYGLVFDVDGDGVPDHRLGMDNAGVGGDRRGWGTDLRTGSTDVGGLDWNTSVGGLSGWGLEEEGLPSDTMYFRGINQDPELRFYAWASLIRDGTVVATDYAPDVGWIPVLP